MVGVIGLPLGSAWSPERRWSERDRVVDRGLGLLISGTEYFRRTERSFADVI
jgi:hypothetical protein